jgi:hypothetical protein
MEARIAGGTMREARQRVAIGLRDALSRDSAIRSAGLKPIASPRFDDIESLQGPLTPSVAVDGFGPFRIL